MKLLVSLSVLLFAAPAFAVLPVSKIQPYKTEALRAADNQPESVIGYANSSNQFYGRQGDAWVPLSSSRSPVYTITFNEGAAKGWYAFKNDGAFTTFSGTAQAVNIGTYGAYSLLVTLGVTGTIIPAAEATGLDITSDASAANNDAVELLAGIYGASGRPFIIGTDPAFKFCIDTKIHDVDGTDGYYIGFRELEAPAAAIASYTDFAAIANVSGDIKTVTDLNNAGETTTTLVSTGWVDDAEKTVCVLVGATGATTYTIDGSTDSDAVAYTFADGLAVVPFVYLIQDANFADDTHIVSWATSWQ